MKREHDGLSEKPEEHLINDSGMNQVELENVTESEFIIDIGYNTAAKCNTFISPRSYLATSAAHYMNGKYVDDIGFQSDNPEFYTGKVFGSGRLTASHDTD